MADTLINRVANSGLFTFNLESHYPQQEMLIFDLKEYLFMELILKEKDFRVALKEHQWEQYQSKILLIVCSADAIIPTWAYMLVSAYAAPYADVIWQGDEESYLKHHYATYIDQLDASQYEEMKVVIKGCSDKPVPACAYVNIVQKLKPFAQSIMFGEPCSTVPIFKRPRKM